MENKKNSKTKMISKKNISSNDKKENTVLSIFSRISFFAPIIIFLVLAYTVGFLKWGLFYERNYLTVAILGAISLLFSILLIKEDRFLLDNFFSNIYDKKIKILLLLNFIFIVVSIIFSTYKYASLIYLSKVFLVLLFFVIGIIFSINEKFKSMFFSFFNILSWVFTTWIFLGIINITFLSGIKTIPILSKFLGSFSPGTMNASLLSSIFGYPNTLASFIGCFVFVSIFLFLKENSSNKKYFQILKLFILVLGFFMTQSRGSFILLITCLSLFYFIHLFLLGGKSRKISFVVLSLLIVFLSSFLFAPSRNFVSYIIFPKTLQINGEYSIQDRINLVKDGLIYFSKNPIIGTGVDTFKYNFALYQKSSNLKSQTIDPHSFLISELGETGIIGTLLLFSLIILIFSNTFKKIKLINSCYIPIIFAAVFGILHSFIDWDWLYVLSLLNTILLFGFAYGNSIFIESSITTAAVKTKEMFNFKPIAIVSILMIVFLSYFLAARINYDNIVVTGDDSQYFASKMVPYNVDYLMLKARTSYLSGGEYLTVKDYLERSTRYAKNYAMPWQSFSEFMLSTEDPEALNTALKTVELSPYDYYSNFLLSKAYYLVRDYEKAEQFAKKSIEIKPDYVYSQIALGKAEIKLENLSKAISILKRVWDKDWTNLDAATSLSEAYGLSGNKEKQLYIVGTSFFTSALSNNEEVATLFKKLAPAISLTGLSDSRQATINNSDTYTLNWKIEGANIEKASKIVITLEDIETKQITRVADLDVKLKSYEFVLAPGSYKVSVNLVTKDPFYIKALNGDRLNTSSTTVFVNTEDTTKISMDKAEKLKKVALNNLKVFPFYYPADYTLALLSGDELTAYTYLEKAFEYQLTPSGNAAIANLINNFVQIKAFLGIKETSIGTHEPLTLLIDPSKLNTTLLNKIELYARGTDNISHYLGTVYTSNFKDAEYPIFLRTWNLAPGKYKILVSFSNTFVSKHKLKEPIVVYNLEILNKDFNSDNIDSYLSIVDKRISENKADLNYLCYIRGYFRYSQKKYLDSLLDLKDACEDPELTDARNKYLSLLPSIRLKEVLYKDVYLDSPFIASWDVLRKDSLIGVDQISFALYSKETDKTLLVSRVKVTDGKVISFNLFDNIPEGKYELITNYFGQEPYSKYGGEGWSIAENTGIYITLRKTNMPNNFGAGTFTEVKKFYSESPAFDSNLAWWLGELALSNKDYSNVSYYFNLASFGGEKASYCKQILKELNIPNISPVWVGFNGELKNEIYMPMSVGFMLQNFSDNLLPKEFQIQFLNKDNLKVLRTYKISSFNVWSDHTIFSTIFTDLPVGEYYAKLIIQQVKDGRNLKVVSYNSFKILEEKGDGYTKENLDDFENLAKMNPKTATFNCIMARVNYYRNNYSEALKYLVLAQKNGFNNCLIGTSLYSDLQSKKDTFGKIITLKDNSFICIEGSENNNYTFTDVLARNNKTDSWTYLSYTVKDNLINLNDDQINSKFGNNSEYSILAKDKNNNLIIVPLIGPINIK